MELNSKIRYSENDHYKWGFNDSWFNEPEAEGYFQVSIGSCTRIPESFRQECINAARLLGQQFTKPILVGLSGGFDSQVVCLSMINANVPFTPVILKLHDGKGNYYNDFDTKGAFHFCEKFNITPIVEELNLDDFYCNTAWELIRDYCITVAEIAVQLHLIIKYKDTHAYVNGGGDPVLDRIYNEDTDSYETVYKLGPTPIQQYLIKHDIEGCVKFFMYTPEQIAAYLDHPVMHYFDNARDSIHDRSTWEYFTFVVKPMMYVDQWPELIQRRKNTGFERVPYFEKVRELTSRMNEHINPGAKKVVWTYTEILGHLLNGDGEIKTWRSKDERDFY